MTINVRFQHCKMACRTHRRSTLNTIDPNAPSGASTAAPYFVDRRSLQLIAFCSLQILDRGFDFCVFCLRLTFACFCTYLQVLGVFRQSVFLLRGFGDLQLSWRKKHRKSTKTMPKSIQIHSKSIPNSPAGRLRPQGVLKLGEDVLSFWILSPWILPLVSFCNMFVFILDKIQ